MSKKYVSIKGQTKEETVEAMMGMLATLHEVALAKIPPQDFLDAGPKLYPNDDLAQEYSILLKLSKMHIAKIEELAATDHIDKEAITVYYWMKDLKELLEDIKLAILVPPVTLH